MQIYKVRYSLPKDNIGYTRNSFEVVISQDIVDAIETTKFYHPGAHIWTAAHHGKVTRLSIKTFAKLAEVK